MCKKWQQSCFNSEEVTTLYNILLMQMVSVYDNALANNNLGGVFCYLFCFTLKCSCSPVYDGCSGKVPVLQFFINIGLNKIIKL